jgi:lipopolysaccharide export system permease protein
MRGATMGNPKIRDGCGPRVRLRGGSHGCDGVDRQVYFPHDAASFAVVLVSLTGVIWITQALRGIDLMTSQGQTILTFLGITSLVIRRWS